MASRTFLSVFRAGLVTSVVFASGCGGVDDSGGRGGGISDAGQSAGGSITGGGLGGTPAGGSSSGDPSTGGVASTAGDSSGGGATAGGQAVETGGEPGTGGEGGEPSEATKGYTFDSDRASWEVRSTDPVSLAGVANLVWSFDDGNPQPGMLELIAPFSGSDQRVAIGVRLPAPVDLRGKTVRAYIRISFGVDGDLAAHPASAKIYVSSGSNDVHAEAGRSIDTTEAWTSVAFEASNPALIDTGSGEYDPSDIREIGIQLDTGGTSMTAQAAVDLIDTVSY